MTPLLDPLDEPELLLELEDELLELAGAPDELEVDEPPLEPLPPEEPPVATPLDVDPLLPAPPPELEVVPPSSPSPPDPPELPTGPHATPTLTRSAIEGSHA
jgi:hypothetical protein